ncbi:MAG: M15 family metallopeptidase [Bernardetiaceae bacterium]|nr:M15 family metallopeptidase [Bernardetiaceae bacterium]
MRFFIYITFSLLLSCSLLACGSDTVHQAQSQSDAEIDSLFTLEIADTIKPLVVSPPRFNYDSFYSLLPDSAMVELVRWDSTFVLDIRYATADNFMNKAVYPCGKCLLRKEVAMALMEAQKEFMTMGYRIKIYDGYRPLSVQWDLWNSTDQKQYVANPRYGSNHNRGTAVDLTLINAETLEELPMGTDYDFFGKQAHHSYQQHTKEVLENRILLKNTLRKYGFSPFSREWWHYDYKNRYPLSDEPLPCEEE